MQSLVLQKLNHIQFTLFACLIFFLPGNSHYNITSKKSFPEQQLFYPALVNEFYELNESKHFWFSGKDNSKVLRRQLVSLIDTSFDYGIIKNKYHEAEIKKWVDAAPADSLAVAGTEKIFTDAAIAMFKDIYQGYTLKAGVGYDPVSPKYTEQDNKFILSALLQVYTNGRLLTIAASLEPQTNEYFQLKNELKIQKTKKDKLKIQKLIVSINYYRLIHHFKLDQKIVINIPAATLNYYEHDSLKLFMKVVAGKTQTPTPLFSAYFSEVILYPYWYVPASIALKELLPGIKKNPSILDDMNMQVIDESGKVLDSHKLNWSSYNSDYFPYRLRQSTGCDNSLGVIKFNITSPYGVFLHDTNYKTVFSSTSRFYSHGCIRLEKPIDLGNHLLHEKLDTTFLQSCFKEQKPVTVSVDNPVPVFVVYMLAEADKSGKVKYYGDVYKLLK